MGKKNAKKNDVELLAEGLADDASPRQKAEAIAAFVEGRISGLREDVAGLVARQKQNIAEAEGSDDPKVKAAANDATKAVKAADAAVKEAAAEPTPEKAKEASEKVEEAEQSVTKVESDLEAMVRDHDNALYGKEIGLVGRVAKLEEGQVGLGSSVDGLWVQVRANARAIAIGTTAGLARIARVSIAVFGVTALLWLAVVLVSGKATIANSWNYGIGLAAIAAGLTYVVMAAMLDGWGRGDGTAAEAEAEAGVDIVRPVH